MDETYEKRRGLYLRQKMEHAMPPKPKKGGDIRKELEYYSALALSIRNKEGEGQSFAKVLLKTAALHAKLGASSYHLRLPGRRRGYLRPPSADSATALAGFTPRQAARIKRRQR